MAQKDEVLKFIRRNGSITPAQAFSRLNLACLAERVRDLRRDGHKIATEMVKRKGKTYARYFMQA